MLAPLLALAVAATPPHTLGLELDAPMPVQVVASRVAWGGGLGLAVLLPLGEAWDLRIGANFDLAVAEVPTFSGGTTLSGFGDLTGNAAAVHHFGKRDHVHPYLGVEGTFGSVAEDLRLHGLAPQPASKKNDPNIVGGVGFGVGAQAGVELPVSPNLALGLGVEATELLRVGTGPIEASTVLREKLALVLRF